MTNIDLKTQQLHVGATVGLNPDETEQMDMFWQKKMTLQQILNDKILLQ